MYTIYMHVNTVNGKAYIGQTCRPLHKRFRTDFLGYKASDAFYNAVEKYGAGAFKTEILCRVETVEEANRIEQTLIAAYGTLSPGGYNLRSGGLNGTFSEETRRKIGKKSKGRKHSAEVKQKMSQVRTGRKHSEITKQRMSESSKGRNVSEGTKQKLREINTGKKHSEETKRKIGNAVSGQNNGFFGRKHTEESKQKMREAKRKRRLERTGQLSLFEDN